MNIYDKYYLDDKTIDNIYRAGMIIFDTSALLDIYFYSEEAQLEIFESVFYGLKGRLWISSQVYFEYLKNKDHVQNKPYMAYESLITKQKGKGDTEGGWFLKIEETCKELGKDELNVIRGNLKTLRERTSVKNKKHPILEIETEFDHFETEISELEEQIKKFKLEAEKFTNAVEKEIESQKAKIQMPTDDLQQAIEIYFVIGTELSYKKMMEIADEGKRRYEEKIPPGYEDRNKEGLSKYGDLFAWKEILNYAKGQQCDVLFVTNDVKSDWIDKEQQCFRFELLREFNAVTGKSIWQTNMKDFLYRITKLNPQTRLSSETLEEVSAVYVDNKLDEEQQRDERNQLYTELLRKWLENEPYSLVSDLAENEDWRVFGKYYIYKGLNSLGTECIIMLNILDRISYAGVLHAFENLKNIRSYYKSFGKNYDYLQIILVQSRDKVNKLKELMIKKPKLQKSFNSPHVNNVMLYMLEGELVYVDSNCPMG